MKRLTVMSFSAAIALAGAIEARAALKYQTGDYAAQDALVMHLDGICNVGANVPHDPNAKIWVNLANANNPANIVSNPSSGWRNGSGYYFCWDESASHATLASAAPAMTQATFEFVFEGDWGSQTAKNWGPHFISGDNDHKICMGASASPLLFRQKEWVGTTSDDYCRIAGWSWKQASFTIGGIGDTRKGYDQGVLVDTKPRAVADEGSIPATMWMVGSRRNQVDYGRQLTGIMKSVRIYNRALTADEVEQNAAIDAARFDGVMPVTNAVVATTVAGAEGVEPTGVYAVEGSHTFTAPPSAKVGSTTYACTGYTLETWENGGWSVPVSVEAFAVDVSKDEKVRIIWQWEASSGTLGVADVGAYSSDGIKVWYDGIRNAGKTMPHADSPTTWRELASDKSANITSNANSHWTSDGYFFAVGPNNERSYAYLRQLVSLGTVGTIEIACDTKASDQTAEWAKYLTFGYTSEQWGSSYENGMAVQVYRNGDYLRLADDAWTGNTYNDYGSWDYRANMTSPWDGKHAAFVVDTSDHRSYKLGARDMVRPRAVVKEMPAAFWIMGSTYYNGTTGNDQLVGTMKAVRAYSRVLSDAEISRHYSIDVWRFDGVVPISNAVEVVADPRGLAGREAAGVYFPQGWTFTAGSSTIIVGGRTYEPCGYVIEAWDAATETYRVVDASDSATTWTAPAAAPFATCRLRWKWRMVGGIRSAADYDVGDYVQGGLVAWLDGIRNVGIDHPHDSEATTWKDLSCRASEVTLRTNDRTYWTDDGYYFCLGSGNECSYAYLRQTLSLGETGTIEFASDVDLTKKNPTGVNNYVGRFVSYVTGTASGAFSDSCIRNQGDTQLEWNADNWSGTVWQDRVKTTPTWYGRHAAFVMAEDSYTSFKAGARDQSKTRLSVVEMPKLYWMIGNKYNESWIANQLTGTMKALRLYNRPLSDAEIAQNYKVDVARFDGVLSVTNVVVAGKYTDYEGLAAGEYEVLGAGTFTAGAATDGKGKVRPVVGYTIEAWENGAWSAPVSYSGSSYTYTEGTSPAKVRLTWKWQPDGMLISIR